MGLPSWRTVIPFILLSGFTHLCVADITPGIFWRNAGTWDRIPSPIGSWGQAAVPRDDNPSLLLTLEYPGGITAEALAVLRDMRRNSQDYGRMAIENKDVWTDDELDQRILDQINKSGYYALQVFDYLQRSQRFPKDTLGLRSVTIDVDPKQKRALRVVRYGVPVPSVLTVRFEVERLAIDMSNQRYGYIDFNTFGNAVAPEFVVVTEPSAWPATGGAVMSVGNRSWTGGSLAFSCPPQMCQAEAEDFSEMLNFLDPFIGPLPESEGVAIDDPKSSLPYPRGLGMREVVFEQPAAIASADTVPIGDDEKSGYALGRYIEHVALQALSQVDPYLATRIQWKNYIALYDKNLSARWPNIDLSLQETKQLGYIKKIMKAERGVISQQSENFAETMLQGPTGKALRNQLVTEYRLIQDLQLADAQATSSTLLSLVSSTTTLLANRGNTNRLATALAISEQIASKTSSQDAAMQERQSQFAINYEEFNWKSGHQDTLVFDGESIRLTAATTLRSALRTKYSNRFPDASDKQANRCADISESGYSYRFLTGRCLSGGVEGGAPIFPSGETYFERYNGNGGFVNMSELEFVNGGPRGPEFTYGSCLYINPSPPSKRLPFDSHNCVSLSSPQAVLDAVRLSGVHPVTYHHFTQKGGWGVKGVGESVSLQRYAIFAIHGDSTVLEIKWSFEGTQYIVTDPESKKLRPATSQERSQLDLAWTDWRALRAKLISYDDVR
jgi:hypothetical protein